VNGKGREDSAPRSIAVEKTCRIKGPVELWFSLAAMNAETGALSCSDFLACGKNAIARAGGELRAQQHLGYPIVTLSTGSYKKSRHGGYTSIPVFIMPATTPRPRP